MEAKHESILSPELLGPVFKTENITLRQALYDNNTNRRLRLLATFVPDELICLIEEQAKVVDFDFVILLLLDISSLYSLFDKFCNCQNNGSSGLSQIFNLCTSAIIEQICFNGGDVLQFSDSGILSMWKQKEGELILEAMQRTISCSFSIKEALLDLESDFVDISKVFIKSAISAGSLTFVTIGNEDVRHYTVIGEPMTTVMEAVKLFKTRDLILTKSAWRHCLLINYVHVIQDKNHIKITKELKKQKLVKINADKKNVELICKPATYGNKSKSSTKKYRYYREISKALAALKTSPLDIWKHRKCLAIVTNLETEKQIVTNRHRILDSCKNHIGVTLKTFIIWPILQQIENNQPLEHLSEMKKVTVVMIKVSVSKNSQLLFLADFCHAIILKACKNVGWIEGVSLRESSIVFRVIFGIRTYLKNFNHCRFGVQCAWVLLNFFKLENDIGDVSIGVATGTVCCTVVGHVARQQYAIIGPPITKADNIMLISYNKVMCDLDTLINSEMKKTNFLSSGLINIEGHEKGYVFVCSDKNKHEDEALRELKNAYPILGRFDEVELFSNILDDIGLPDRSHAGVIIEGGIRAGKSRVLDAFDACARARQIEVVKLTLHTSFAIKPYAIIHKILEQILDAEDCKTVAETERNVVKKLGSVIPVRDFCYLNKILRVQFQLSEQYIIDTDWDRHHKTISIFDRILKIKNRKICILLDDVHFMDYMSWQFLTQALNNKNVVMAMTLLETQSWQELSRVEADICKDKRLIRQALTNLESSLLPTLVCQFLNVQAFSVELHDFIIHSRAKSPGWFELFLSLVNVCGGFEIIHTSPQEAANYELIISDSLLNSRIELELFPDEVAPTEPWNKQNEIVICLTNEKFQMVDSLKNRGINGLVLEIFWRLSPYEQEVVKCAAVLGQVFVRSILEMIIPNHQSLKTSAAIENLMRARIFECASLQRQHTRIGDLSVCAFKPRATFSDMHHLLRCCCRSRYIPPTEKDLAHYAHCSFIEFKVSVFQNEIYEQIPEVERKLIHRKIVDIYKKDARKCSACGGGTFLEVPGKEKLEKTTKASVAVVTENNLESLIEKHSVNALSINSEQRGNRSISEESTVVRGLSIMRTSFETDDVNDLPSMSSRCRKRKYSSSLFGKSKFHSAACDEMDLSSWLPNFGYIDFRHCRCLGVIECVFLKLQQHLECIDNYKKIINFNMEYAAALIKHGQPGYALRFLTIAGEKNDFVNATVNRKKLALHRKMIKKSMILRLRGDAYMLLGNYPQAKSNYFEALSLYNTSFTTNELLTGYKTACAELRQNLRWAFASPLVGLAATKHEQRLNAVRQNVALSLSRVSDILLINNRPKAAKLASAQSILFGFSSFQSCNFGNQCQLYLSFAENHGQLGELALVERVQRYMLFAVEQKREWLGSEELVSLARLCASTLNLSWLHGQLGRAVHFGERALCVAKTFHVVRLDCDLLVAMVQTLIRLKRVCETMDVLRQLRDLAPEDIDKSATTWYYALCMDLLLDAGLLVESYDSCAGYARKVLAGKAGYCVARDNRGLKRLLAGLWLWQLRKGDLTSTTFVRSLDVFMADLAIDDCSQIITLCKILECHMLLLMRCVNMKRGSKLELLLEDIEMLIEWLDEIAESVEFIKPHYYLLRAYFGLLQSRTDAMESYLRQAEKIAESQMNVMTLAWIICNKNTWLAVSYNNMARNWEENISYRNTIAWQDLDTFDLNDWSGLLYPLPIPDSYI